MSRYLSAKYTPHFLLVLALVGTGVALVLLARAGGPTARVESSAGVEQATAAAVSTVPFAGRASPSPIATSISERGSAGATTESTPEPALTTVATLPLEGRRIGLDPGHGPRKDLGAVLVDPETEKLVLAEHEFNLDVAMRAREILEARGADVVLTRETKDTFTAPWPADVNGDGISEGANDDLQIRVDILNDFKAEAFLSIHANGGTWNPARREPVQVLYCGAPDCLLPEENRALGRVVLNHLLDRLVEAGHPVTGELLDDLKADSEDPPQHMFILGPKKLPRHVRETYMPGVIVESLYVTHPEHAAALKQDSVRQAVALAYADALEEFLLGTVTQQP